MGRNTNLIKVFSDNPEKQAVCSRRAAWIPLFAVALLAGCNGNGDGHNTDEDQARTGPASQPDDQPLRELRAARFASEDDVALMAPGSIYDETGIGETRMLLAIRLAGGEDLSGASRGEGLDECTAGGSIDRLSRQIQPVDSPFTDEEYDVIVTRDNNCQQELLGVPFNQRSEGVRQIGHPVSLTGNGRFLTSMDFYSYEQSGSSLTDTYDVEGFLLWSRWLDSHIHLMRDQPGEIYGDAGGAIHINHLSLMGEGREPLEENEMGSGSVTLLQMGNPVTGERLELEFEPVDGHDIEEKRRERYRGIYGYELVSSTGSDLSDCPYGRFHVETDGWLEATPIAGEEADAVTGEIGIPHWVNGRVTMTDDHGNTARVTHDQNRRQLIVSLNGHAPKSYTRNDLEALRVQRMMACMQ
ncbi:MAG: hypothetical protein R3296_06555 [Oleiphilaceae bacterium]|nr:hypothetical protein [Oleiphilaceae bacterium]